MEVKGKVKSIGSVEARTEKFSTRMLRLDLTTFNPNTGDPFVNEAEFQFSNKNMSLLD